MNVAAMVQKEIILLLSAQPLKTTRMPSGEPFKGKAIRPIHPAHLSENRNRILPYNPLGLPYRMQCRTNL